ncbi:MULTISPECIES: sensor histidine kinase [Bacteria]|uniref:sensor histidine kinase n=1 Tax=Bacteria TaxID=2 RepID=UPI003C7D0C56
MTTVQEPTTAMSTAPVVPPQTRIAVAPNRKGYAEAWRWAPGAALYLVVLSIPTAILGMALILSVFLVGVGSIVLVIGVPLMVAGLYLSRGFAVTDVALQGIGGAPGFPAPDWRRGRSGDGRWARLIQPLRNGHYWMALLYGAVVRPVIAILTFGLSTAWLALSLGGPTYWFWSRFVPTNRESERVWVTWAVEHIFFGIDQSPNTEVWASALYLVVGLVFLLTLPLVLRGLLFLHHAAAAAMLGRWAADDFGAQVAAMDASRGAAIRAEDAALRRLERDIHDGPQQRLVRLQMDLAAIERRAADGDLDAAARLAKESRGQAQSALEELRALAGGVAPPLLQDRGIVEALRALGAVSPIPVSTSIDPEIDRRLTPETARNLYFIVAELLTNAAKHSGATAVALSASKTAEEVVVTVHDDGRGGAVYQDGHGLDGLRGRVQGLRGQLRIDSPEGGPTVIVVRLPIAAA